MGDDKTVVRAPTSGLRFLFLPCLQPTGSSDVKCYYKSKLLMKVKFTCLT